MISGVILRNKIEYFISKYHKSIVKYAILGIILDFKNIRLAWILSFNLVANVTEK